jgi:Tol biopolymer transport system component
MASSNLPPNDHPGAAPASGDRLDSWKEIATYLNRGVRTVVRWEREEGLPVHRLVHDTRGSVYAYRSELDAWWKSRRGHLEQVQPVPAARPRRRLLWGAVLLAGIAIVALALWVVLPHGGPQPALRTVPLTSYPGIELSPAFSPDGRQVAFAWNGEKQDNFDIYVKLVGSEDRPLRLTTLPARDNFPAWSPDGRQIAFLRAASENDYGIFLVPALGGVERKVAEVSISVASRPSLAWTPDGRWLVTAATVSGPRTSALRLVSAESGEMRQLTTPPATWWGDVGGVPSPDGRHLAFLRRPTFWVPDIFVLPLSRDFLPLGEPRRLTNQGWWTANSLRWTADGRELLCVREREGAADLWRIPVAESGSARLVSAIGRAGVDLAVSPLGDKLAYSDYYRDTDIWRLELNQGRAPKPIRYVSSTRLELSPSISPDGKRIVFTSLRSGSSQIWVADSDGSNVAPLTPPRQPVAGAPRWSPDGAQIAFDGLIEGDYDVYVISAAGGKPRRLTANPVTDAVPSWSRDGKWIYFASNRTGEFRIWKMPSSQGPGSEVQVTKKGSAWLGLAFESTDGKFLYYSVPHSQGPASASVWRMPAQGGEEVPVIPSINNVRNFDVVDDGIYFETAVSRGQFSLCFYRFATGKSELIAKIDKEGYQCLSISPNRRWLLFNALEERGGDLWLVENFR